MIRTGIMQCLKCGNTEFIELDDDSKTGDIIMARCQANRVNGNQCTCKEHEITSITIDVDYDGIVKTGNIIVCSRCGNEIVYECAGHITRRVGYKFKLACSCESRFKVDHVLVSISLLT